MSDHLSPETVSDLSEGLLGSFEAAAARRHLSECAQCADIRDRLSSMSVLLGSLPEPGPMPDDVVARVDTALREAAMQPRPTVTGMAAARERRKVSRSTRWLQAAAAVVLIAGAGAVIVPAVLNGSDRSDSGSSTAAGDSGYDMAEAPPGAAEITASGLDYSRATVGAQARRLVTRTPALPGPSRNSAPAKAPSVPSPEAAGGDTAADSDRLADAAALASCVEALAGPGVVPLAVDIGRFEGQPATVVIVLPGAAPDRLSVYVVGPGCSLQDDQTKYFESVPR